MESGELDMAKSSGKRVAISAPATAIAEVGVPDVWQQLPIDHPVYPLIGRVVVAGANLEHALDVIIADLVGNKHTAACLTAQMMGPWPRYLSIIALLSHKELPKEIASTVKKLEGQTRTWVDERNRLAHDAWMASDRTQKSAQYRKMPKGKLTYGLEIVEIEKIERTLAGLESLRTKALSLRRDILNALSASPNKDQK